MIYEQSCYIKILFVHVIIAIATLNRMYKHEGALSPVDMPPYQHS